MYDVEAQRSAFDIFKAKNFGFGENQVAADKWVTILEEAKSVYRKLKKKSKKSHCGEVLGRVEERLMGLVGGTETALVIQSVTNG